MALIDIGSQKQLFVDDYLIESMANTRPLLNPARKAEENPVLRPERPWEGTGLTVRNVTYDEDERVFKMWYTGRTLKAHRGDKEIIITGEHADPPPVNCLAVSDDGVSWERPVLGHVEFDGSRENNILPDDSVPDKFFLDPHEDDPTKRYKGMNPMGSVDTAGMQIDLVYSADGFTWTPYENNPVIDTSPRIGKWGPTEYMGWDPIRQVYAVHMENCLHRRSPMGKRLIGRAESPDMIEWSDPETILLPDGDDPPDTEFYDLHVIVYEGMYLGVLWIFSTTNTTHHPELVFSRDGIRYERKYRSPFIERSAKWQFDSTSIYTQAPIVHGDRVLFYYTGTNWRSPEQLLALGRDTRAIGLAVTPLDGFVSLDGSKGVSLGLELGPERGAEDLYMTRLPGVSDEVWRSSFSQMVTRSFSFSGSQLHLNVQPALQQWGAGPCEVRIELLEPNHEYVKGYEFADADPVTTSGLDQVVSWRGSSDLSSFAGKAIKLRFYFKNAKLYSFQFR